MKQRREITFLPPGVRVYFPRESMAKRDLLNRLFGEAERWDYGELDLPTLDYYESITRGISQELALRTYQFQDDEGQLMALRPDATAQVAKILSGRFDRKQLPGRYCYACRSFRAFELRRGELREFQQFGAEILSEDRFQSDLELLLFLFELLELIEVEDVILDLGHVDVYKGLVEGVDLDPLQARRLWQEIHRKNSPDLSALLEELPLSDARKEILRALPTLYGGEEIFDDVDELLNGASESSKRAIENLKKLYHKLNQAGVSERITLDLGVVRDLDYYTGVVFEGLLPGSGKPVIGGGRYDTLYGKYGDSIPATGFAMEIDRILPSYDESTEPLEHQLVWCPQPTPKALESLREMRNSARIDVHFSEPDSNKKGYLIDQFGKKTNLSNE